MKLLFALLLLGAIVVGSNAQPKNSTLYDVWDYLNEYFPNTPLYNNTGLGNCSFSVSSYIPEIQNYMNTGVCMLHTFWPEAALRCFKHVLDIDNTLAMGWWGVYQALSWDYGLSYARSQALAQAVLMASFTSTTTAREKLYVQAEQYNQANYTSSYLSLFQQYPNDTNAKAFWAWNTISNTINFMGFPKDGRAAAQQMLANQTALYPNDIGYEHYQIHAWEDTLDPYNGMHAAQLMGVLSPLAGHNVHMAGHVYFLMGDHDAAHDAFLAGIQADKWAMGNFTVDFMLYWEYIHNIAYLTGNLGEGGRYQEAVQWGQFLQNLKVNYSFPLLTDWDPVYNRAAGRYFFQGLIALPLVYFQYGNWSGAQSTLTDIINLLTPTVTTQNNYLLKYYDALRQYSCAMAGFEQSDIIQMQSCIANLSALYTTLGPIMNRSTENGFQVGKRVYQSLGVNIAEAQGALLALNGSWDASLSQLIIANYSEGNITYNEPPIYSRPVLATYAEVLYRRANATNDTSYLTQALDAYTQIIHSPWHNNSGFGWFGIGQTYALLKQRANANSSFISFLNYWKSADKDLPQVVFALNYLNSTDPVIPSTTSGTSGTSGTPGTTSGTPGTTSSESVTPSTTGSPSHASLAMPSFVLLLFCVLYFFA